MNLRISHKNLDRKSFEDLFHEHFEALCRFAKGYVNDTDAAQEIVQDVFINLWNKRDSIDRERSVRSYLFTSVKNRCLNHIRDHKKFRSVYLDVEVELEIPYEPTDTLSEEETSEKIAVALDKLPEKCRQVFEMSRFNEMKYKDIAEALNISVKTVEVQISRALKILRFELKEFLMVLIMLMIK